MGIRICTAAPRASGWGVLLDGISRLRIRSIYRSLKNKRETETDKQYADDYAYNPRGNL